MALDRDDLRVLRPAIERRLAEVEEEAAHLRRLLGQTVSRVASAVGKALKGKKRARRAMSAAQKADVSKRMKKYWEKRRKARKG